MGEATLARVAACAVLAGCRPAYFPVVAAAARAALDPAFNLHGQAVTTQPAGQLVVVNGPVREAIGPEQRHGRARARVPGQPHHRPGAAAAGQPDRRGDARRDGPRRRSGRWARSGFCIAEDEEGSPWEPLHVERGFAAGQSVVTVIGSDAPLSISDHRSRTPEDLACGAGLGGGQHLEHQLVAAGGAVGVRDLPGARRDVPRRRVEPSSGCASSCSRRCAGPPASCAAARRPPLYTRRDPRRAGAQVGVARGHRAARGGRRGRALLCCSRARAPAWASRSSPGRWSHRGR